MKDYYLNFTKNTEKKNGKEQQNLDEISQFKKKDRNWR